MIPSAEFLTATPEETIALARRIAPRLPAGPTMLIGDLGAGKTTFVKGVASALDAAPEDDVTSPTFSLIHEYGDPTRLFHMDLYRLESLTEVLALGIEEILDRQVPVLIEWGERFPGLWPPESPAIRFFELPTGQRRIVVEGLFA
jgi:tRNA threonylcarbamoyladenosine biosynthesis protein TsaE